VDIVSREASARGLRASSSLAWFGLGEGKSIGSQDETLEAGICVRVCLK
jgi:hypothetical protein